MLKEEKENINTEEEEEDEVKVPSKYLLNNIYLDHKPEVIFLLYY